MPWPVRLSASVAWLSKCLESREEPRKRLESRNTSRPFSVSPVISTMDGPHPFKDPQESLEATKGISEKECFRGTMISFSAP